MGKKGSIMPLKLLTVLFVLYSISSLHFVQAEQEKCGADIEPWYGWLTNCDESLGPEKCVRQGRHCAYCFDEKTSEGAEGSTQPIGCGLKGMLEAKKLSKP